MEYYHDVRGTQPPRPSPPHSASLSALRSRRRRLNPFLSWTGARKPSVRCAPARREPHRRNGRRHRAGKAGAACTGLCCQLWEEARWSGSSLHKLEEDENLWDFICVTWFLRPENEARLKRRFSTGGVSGPACFPRHEVATYIYWTKMKMESHFLFCRVNELLKSLNWIVRLAE